MARIIVDRNCEMISSCSKGKVNILLLLLHSVFFICYSVQVAYAQGKSVFGTVSDASSGEVLIGATLFDPESGKGYVTNSYGYFAITGIVDSIRVKVSFIGYQTESVSLTPGSIPVSIKLIPQSAEIEEVVIVHGANNRSKSHGQVTISSIDLKNTPVLLAEKDVLKTIQLLPGIQQNSEGTSNFSVRGGSHDQNLMLIDGIPVYNINHLWGFVSVFNTEAVNNVSFYKGGIPANYGGRLSSVVDVMLREGNYDRTTGKISLGLISSKFTLEGPLQKGKSSFLLTGRRTFYDFIVSPVLYTMYDAMPGYYFQDYTLKLNYKINPYNTIYLSSYIGNDKAYIVEAYKNEMQDLSYRNRSDLGWTNITTAFRWNNSKVRNLFSNVTLAYTYFNYLNSFKYTEKVLSTGNSSVDYQGYHSGINDLISKWNLSYYGFSKQQINLGVDYTFHLFNPGITNSYYETDGGGDDEHHIAKGSKKMGRELNIFIDDKLQLGRFSSQIGLRYSIFYTDGKIFSGLQPRLSVEFKASEAVSVFAGYNRMFQYLHLVSNSNLGMPTDLWLPISDKIPPQQADQLSAGIKYRVNQSVQVSVEAYSKEMQNLAEYRDGVVLNNRTADWSEILITGNGKSQGVELLLELSKKKLSGWVSYSLSKSNRSFEDIKQGETFPFQYDRRHVANIFLSYKITPSKSLSASWVASTGHRMTINHDNYIVNGQVILNLSNRNNYQLPPYHHLDITYTSSKIKKRGTRNWTIGIYNVYAHHNTFIVARRDRNTNEFNPSKLYSVCLFPFVPFVAWEYIFR